MTSSVSEGGHKLIVSTSPSLISNPKVYVGNIDSNAAWNYSTYNKVGSLGYGFESY